MKIISPFHDYYDSAMAYGSDPLAVYKRETSMRLALGIDGLDPQMLPWNASAGHARAGARSLEVYDSKLDVQNMGAWQLDQHQYRNRYINLSEGFLIISGKAYPVWLKNHLIQGGILTNNTGNDWLGTPTATDAEKRLANKLHETKPDAKVISREVQHRSWMTNRTKKAYDNAREKFLAQDFTAFHLALGAPVALVVDKEVLGYLDKIQSQPFEQERIAGRGTPSAVILNPRMADLNMAHVLDPALAFQEISQFVCGVAPGQQMPMVELADNSKIEKKGFDPKYGFRTRPKVK